ncbi:MAG: LuxR family transcriptional regulator, maltose regulon positive regulatory protein [Pseudonocardiales bacterium]|nr:LuxR family transcriptional regulator, maltose regulon positive regulatory protein [Pseudonocardiales bacterium]
MVLVPQAKITVPRLPREFVGRAALCADLDLGATSDVALICAPAGYGKTLLLADWAGTSAATDVAWVGIDHNDNDPRRLWSAVVAAVGGCPSVPTPGPLHAGMTRRPATHPDFIAEFAAALEELTQPIRLILDDVHTLVDPRALESLRTFIRVKPATVQLVLASRLDPPLSLPRLRLTGRLYELRAAQLSFTPPQAAALLQNSGLRLTPDQVDVLHRRTGGWAAGLRLAALGMARSVDHGSFLTQFSGDDRSVADYLVGEILAALPVDLQDFLRVISICAPVPVALAAELSGRDEAGSVLDRLEHQTSLVTATEPRRDLYRIQELLRTHLVADLQRHGVRRVAELHAVAARWWAGQDQPLPALEHAAHSRDPALLGELLHRFAIRLILAGNHAPLRRALASAWAEGAAADPWLLLTSALTRLEAGERAAAKGDLRRAQQLWPTDAGVDLVVLRGVVEQLGADPTGRAPAAIADTEHLPLQPELDALARLGRGDAHLHQDDPAGAHAEFGAALALSRRHGFDYLRLQCLAMLGVVAARCGDLRTMQAMSAEAVVLAAERSWEGSRWSQTATAMLAYSELLRCLPADAKQRTADALATGSAAPPEVHFVLQAVHGAAVFDLGDRADGLAQLQRARSDFGSSRADAPLCAAMAMLEYRAALLLGHTAAARTVLGWLSARSGDYAELVMMRAWADAAEDHHAHARGAIRAVLDGSVPALLPQTVIEGWLLETSIAVAAGERPAARHAMQTALALAEPLAALRPFTQAGPNVPELLVHQHGSFGASEMFADRVLAAGVGHQAQTTILSEREITVLGLLPSMLSLEEIALDLTVSVNTVKSHTRSIYTKLGVSSRRLAVLAAHERGLIIPSIH